jgi:hypothetical protein
VHGIERGEDLDSETRTKEGNAMALVQGLVSLIRWTVAMMRSNTSPKEDVSTPTGQEDDQGLLDASKKRIRDYAILVQRFPEQHPECPPRFLNMVERLDTLAANEIFDLAQHVRNVSNP